MKLTRSLLSPLQSFPGLPLATTISDSLYWFREVNSTMDTARQILPSSNGKDVFAVCATSQLSGRGTYGRKWLAGSHNLYFTASIEMKKIPIPLSLVPLRIGVIVATCIRDRVFSGAPVHLKWPNDVLVGDQKICGVLIEIDEGRMLVGVGCNVSEAPHVDTVGREGGRPATCLRDHFHWVGDQSGEVDFHFKNSTTSSNSSSSSVSREFDGERICKDLAEELVGSLTAWIETNANCRFESGALDSAEKVVRDFEGFMDSTPQILRRDYRVSTKDDAERKENRIENESELDEKERMWVVKGEEVVPMGINPDGTLLVRFTKSGVVQSLVADYLW